jgi:methionyl aminopeptidase
LPLRTNEIPLIRYKTEREIEKIRRAGEVVCRVFSFCSEFVRPGVTTLEIDRRVESLIEGCGAACAFKGLYGFPASICASVNEEALHGIPRDRVLLDGDLVTVDVGVSWDGYHADAARTFAVGDVSGAARALLEATAESLDRGIEQCRPGRRLSDIAWGIETVAKRRGYRIVEGYGGHGIGISLHEEPCVPNSLSPALLGRDLVLKPGLVLAIEPVLKDGDGGLRTLADGWTVVTSDARLAAHFEDTVAITERGPVVLTRPVAA